MVNRIYSMLGIGRKAGKVCGGEFAAEEAVKAGKACLVVLASDASANTKKKFHNMCDYRGIPCLEYGTKEEIGHAVGLEFRAMLAVTDEGIAEKIKSLMVDGGNLNGKN